MNKAVTSILTGMLIFIAGGSVAMEHQHSHQMQSSKEMNMSDEMEITPLM